MFSHDERDVSDDEDGDDDSDLEPSLKIVEEAMEKVQHLLISSKLKCDKCDFVAKNDTGLNMQKKAKHTDKSQ